MLRGLKSAKLVMIERLGEEAEGASVKVLGLLETESGELWLANGAGRRVRLDMNGNIVSLRKGHPYMAIGELRNTILFVRIIRELEFKQYNINYYLETVPKLLL
jgi:hypothetical protein